MFLHLGHTTFKVPRVVSQRYDIIYIVGTELVDTPLESAALVERQCVDTSLESQQDTKGVVESFHRRPLIVVVGYRTVMLAVVVGYGLGGVNFLSP